MASSVASPVHSLQYYLDQARPVLLKIPGMQSVLSADEQAYDDAAAKYPDAVFALMTMNNLFHHDREFSEIHQQAFFSIVEGADIASVRCCYEKRMDSYWEKHLWDD